MIDVAADDDPPPKKPPAHCPWCGGEVKKRWAPNKLLWLTQRLPGVRASYVCLTCKIAVRAFAIPPRPLFETKKAARAEAQRAYDELEASRFTSMYVRDLYARGKCSCSRLGWTNDPCAVHAPMRSTP